MNAASALFRAPEPLDPASHAALRDGGVVGALAVGRLVNALYGGPAKVADVHGRERPANPTDQVIGTKG
mgnify:CR=1 FL=1